jgi:VWFA-related protein
LTVRDVGRQFVDLGADDLVVIEDGVEQKVEVFQEATTPVSIALLLDASGSMRRDAEAVVEAARSFVAALPRQDRITPMLFADRAEFAHDLSLIRLWTEEAIAKYQAGGGTALWDALTASFARLRKVEGRRVVVVLTDGRDENNPGTGPGSRATFDEVLAGLEASEARVFAIGLGPNVDKERLQLLAERSGGDAYFPAQVSSLAAEYRRIIENLRRRYVLSYTSTNVMHDGGWREVEIRAKKPGIVIEHKGGYQAPKEAAGGG